MAHAGVGAHDVHGAGILNGGFKHRQAVGKDLVAAHGAGRAVQARHRAAVGSVVLHFGGDGIGSSQVIALHTQNILAGKFGSQESILAVSFFRPAEPGIPHQVRNGAPYLADAAGPGLGGDGVAHLSGQFRLKGGCQTDLLGENGGIIASVSFKPSSFNKV